MSVKVGITFFCITLICCLGSISSCRKPLPLRFENARFDFGIVEEGMNVDHEFVFTNTGTETVHILSVRPACVCTTIGAWDSVVAPGAKGKIAVTFESPRLNGRIEKVIFVNTNLAEQPSVQLAIHGTIIIPVEIVPLNAWLGDVNASSQELTGSFTITNNLKVPVHIIGIIPPDARIEYVLNTKKQGYKYTLDYTIIPPFTGEGNVRKEFTLQTDNEKYKSVTCRFYYRRVN